MLHFYTPLKHQKASSFLMFSGGVEVKYWLKTKVLTIFAKKHYRRFLAGF